MTRTPGRFALAAASGLIAVLTACGQQTGVSATDGGPSSSPTPSSSPSSPSASPTVGSYPAYPESDYAFTLRVTCFCADANVPVRVTVRGGKVVEATYLRGGMGHHKGDPAPAYRRVTIQDVIDAANDTEAAQVQVEWPQGQDYPSSVYVDQDENMADEELGFQVGNVVVG